MRGSWIILRIGAVGVLLGKLLLLAALLCTAGLLDATPAAENPDGAVGVAVSTWRQPAVSKRSRRKLVEIKRR
jgi:hypothetical protein